jgi:hypothetical protein
LDASVRVSVNSRGVRGPEINYARTPGTYRILIVSDSAMFGSGMEYEDSVPAVLEQLLAPAKVEIVNLSVAAYSTVQEYVLFMEEGRKYHPDLVLLGFAPGNDLQTNYEPLQQLFQKSQRRPFATLDDSGQLVIDYRHAEAAAERAIAKGKPGPLEQLFTNTVIARLVKAAAHKLSGDKRIDPNIYLGPSYMAKYAEQYSVDGMTKAEYDRLWSESWRVTKALIRSMQEQSHAMGAEFGIFVSTSKLQGDPEMRARVTEAFPGIELDIGRIDRDMEQFAKEIGAAFIPVLPSMQEASADTDRPLFFGFEDEHWTKAGNSIVATALMQGLRAENLVPVN